MDELNLFLLSKINISSEQREYMLHKCYGLLVLNVYNHILKRAGSNNKYSFYEICINPFILAEIDIKEDKQLITIYYNIH